MFDKQNNAEYLENVDYAALIRLARRERAKYLAMLFKQVVSLVWRWGKQHMSASKPSRSKTGTHRIRGANAPKSNRV